MTAVDWWGCHPENTMDQIISLYAKPVRMHDIMIWDAIMFHNGTPLMYVDGRLELLAFFKL